MVRNNPRIGNLKKKVLLLLCAGLALGLTRSPKTHWWILKQIPKEWEKVNRQALERAINSLYTSHLIEEKNNRDGTTTLILSENGKQRALRFNIDKLEIKKPEKWDRKWRMVLFDIPEKRTEGRNALRRKLQEIGFHEFQKSALVFPFPCKDEVEFVVEFFSLRPYVRFIVAEHIDNELHLKKIFHLP